MSYSPYITHLTKIYCAYYRLYSYRLSHTFFEKLERAAQVGHLEDHVTPIPRVKFTRSRLVDDASKPVRHVDVEQESIGRFVQTGGAQEPRHGRRRSDMIAHRPSRCRVRQLSKNPVDCPRSELNENDGGGQNANRGHNRRPTRQQAPDDSDQCVAKVAKVVRRSGRRRRRRYHIGRLPTQVLDGAPDACARLMILIVATVRLRQRESLRLRRRRHRDVGDAVGHVGGECRCRPVNAVSTKPDGRRLRRRDDDRIATSERSSTVASRCRLGR